MHIVCIPSTLLTTKQFSDSESRLSAKCDSCMLKTYWIYLLFFSNINTIQIFFHIDFLQGNLDWYFFFRTFFTSGFNLLFIIAFVHIFIKSINSNLVYFVYILYLSIMGRQLRRWIDQSRIQWKAHSREYHSAERNGGIFEDAFAKQGSQKPKNSQCINRK